MPYTTLDLKEYLKDSAFKIELTHLGGIPENVFRHIQNLFCKYSSIPNRIILKKIQHLKNTKDSSGTYKIKYVCWRMEPLVIGAETHLRRNHNSLQIIYKQDINQGRI